MGLKETLADAGVDYEITLNRFSNNASLLERFIKKFPDDGTFKQLEVAIIERNYKEAERAAHTLKGIASNLGFQHLADLNAEIVDLIHSNEHNQIGDVFSNVNEEYSKVVTCLNRL